MRKEAIINYIKEQPAKTARFYKEKTQYAIIATAISILFLGAGVGMAVDRASSTSERTEGILFALAPALFIIAGGNATIDRPKQQ